MIGKVNSGGNGEAIEVAVNGIIQQYKAASNGNISAGDFVKFIQESMAKEYDPVNTGIPGNMFKPMTAAQLSESTVVIQTTSSDTGRHVVACNISGNSITVGSYKLLGSSQDGYYRNCAVNKIDSTRALVVYAIKTGWESQDLYDIVAYVLSVSGTSISIGSKRTVFSGTMTDAPQDDLYSCVVGGNKYAIVTHDITRPDGRFAQDDISLWVGTISGTTCGAATRKKVYTNTYINCTVVAPFSDSKIIIGFGSKGKVANISGTSATIGSEQSFPSSVTNAAWVQLATNKVLFASGVSTFIVTADGTSSFTFGAVFTLPKSCMGVCLLNTNRLLFLHSDSASICNISGTTISLETTYPLSKAIQTGQWVTPCGLSANKAFIPFYNAGYFAEVAEFTSADVISKLTSNDDVIKGVASTSAGAGQNIMVIVPNVGG